MSDDDVASVPTSRKVREQLAPPSDEAMIQDIVSTIDDMLRRDRDNTRKNIEQQGGWEGQLQVNIASLYETSPRFRDPLYDDDEERRGIGEGHLFDYDVKREENHVFQANSRQQVDLWFRPTEPGWPAVGVELKTSSAGQSGKDGSLAARFREDINKCSKGADFNPSPPSGLSKVAGRKWQAEEAPVLADCPKVLFLCIGITHELSDMESLGFTIPKGRVDGEPEEVEQEDPVNPELRQGKTELPGFKRPRANLSPFSRK